MKAMAALAETLSLVERFLDSTAPSVPMLLDRKAHINRPLVESLTKPALLGQTDAVFGGTIVAQGPPEKIIQSKKSRTAPFLKAALRA